MIDNKQDLFYYFIYNKKADKQEIDNNAMV